MHFVFKQAVCLEGKDYARGGHYLHEPVLETLSKNKTFLKYQELGLIQKSERAPGISSADILEKNKKLSEKISSPDPESVEKTSDSDKECSEPNCEPDKPAKKGKKK